MRTLLLGLDGLDPALADEFDLPNIESIGESFEIDTHGNSGPSWVSVLTGLRPKEHGVRKLRPGQDRNSWGGTPIWEKIDGYCGIANVPLTYPPCEIDGWMVTGLMTPERSIYTYPRHLYKELDELGYRIDVWITQNDNHPHGHYGTLPFEFSDEHRDKLIEEIVDVEVQRAKAFEWLLENEPVDFAFLCFTSLDRVQHLAFHDKNIIWEHYQRIDNYVGNILDIIPDDTDIFVTSDHGFRRVQEKSSDLTGDHRMEGFGATNTGDKFLDLEHLHETVVRTANNSKVDKRLDDLGYL